MSRSSLTGHVVDTSTGKPIAKMQIMLFKLTGDSWGHLHNAVTGIDGKFQFPFEPDTTGIVTYKYQFKVGDYYAKLEKKTLYPYIEVVFKVPEGDIYHIPLLLSPYGYTTCGGL